MRANVDPRTVDAFGEEWTRLDQSRVPAEELERTFTSYFALFPWSVLPAHAQGFDLGCGTGRWAKFVAPRVGRLHCIDPSVAVDVARRNLEGFANCELHQATVDEIPLRDESMDFGYSTGVLHHVPNTQAGICAWATKLKPAAPFLVYLYYDLDNRPLWFRWIWKASDVVRRVISRAPARVRYRSNQIIAAFVYWPLARAARLLERLGYQVSSVPLGRISRPEFYTMRTDALDRFGTRLEHRFSAEKVTAMMEAAAFERVQCSDPHRSSAPLVTNPAGIERARRVRRWPLGVTGLPKPRAIGGSRGSFEVSC